jgi:hypothetical protein
MTNLKKEDLFELSNYDSKNITNKGTETISKETLELIEREGVTLETLNKTQITIHGLFPELGNNYIGRYKNLFQNKNLSIGVKWAAVDYYKKKHIYKTVSAYMGWTVVENCTNFYIVKTSKHFNNKSEYLELLPMAKEYLATIDKSLFFGNCGVSLCPLLYGGYVLETYINIGGILQTNVDAVIENICGVNMENITAKIEADKAATEKYWADYKAYNEAKEAERKDIEAPIRESAKKILNDAGYTFQKNIKVYDGLLILGIIVDAGKFYFTATKYQKKGAQKYFRYANHHRTESLIFDFPEYAFCNTNRSGLCSGYIKVEAAKAEPPVKVETKVATPIVKKEVATISSEVRVKIVDYSEKSFAVIGNTKAISETLKQLGGSFNFRLSCGAGWIFSKTKLETVKAKLNIAVF